MLGKILHLHNFHTTGYYERTSEIFFPINKNYLAAVHGNGSVFLVDKLTFRAASRPLSSLSTEDPLISFRETPGFPGIQFLKPLPSLITSNTDHSHNDILHYIFS